MMNPPTLRDVLGQLRAEGRTVTSDEARLAQALHSDDADGASQAWYVRVLVFFGAWAATGFFLAFLGLLRIIDDRAGALAVGLVLVVASTVLRRQTRHDGLHQLALSLSLAGRCLVYTGVGDRGATTAALTALVLEPVVIALYPDAVSRFAGAGGMWMALLVLLDSVNAPPQVLELATVGLGLLTALAWEHASSLAARRHGDIHASVAMALAVALIGTTMVRPWRVHHGWDLHEIHTSYLVAAGLTLVLAWVVGRVRREHLGRPAWGALAVTGVFGLLTSPAPTLVASVLVMALGLHRRQRLLLGLGAAGLAIGLARFYYDLELSLLAKAGALVASGALLLAARIPVEAAVRRLER